METRRHPDGLRQLPSVGNSFNNESHVTGIELFNQGHFFAAHEALEDVWRAAPEREKKFWQGLIQVAVGFHHHSEGNRVGAKSLLARAERNLRTYPAQFRGIQLAPLLTSLAEWQRALAEKLVDPPRPAIEFSDTILSGK